MILLRRLLKPTKERLSELPGSLLVANYSKDFRSYRDAHLLCEACGRKTQEWPHHVRTRGAGGDDDPSNLLELCKEHHAEIHTMGRTQFVEHFPHLYDKIMDAIARPR